MHNAKCRFLICLAVGNTNYSNGLAETSMQVQLLHEKLYDYLLWNRFCNLRGRLNSNISIYLYLEHENKYFKEQLKTYRGIYKQAPIDRNTKSESAVNIILTNHDTSLSTRKPASQGTDPVSSLMNRFRDKCIYILQLRLT